jgi:hypothetical protein
MALSEVLKTLVQLPPEQPEAEQLGKFGGVSTDGVKEIPSWSRS